MARIKLFFLCFLLWIQSVAAQTLPEKVLSLRLSLLMDMSSDIERVSRPHPHLKLVIHNNTDTAAAFYKPDNPWGDQAIRLELLLHDSLFTLHYSSFCGEKYYPEASVLEPGDSMVFELSVERCYQHGPCPCVYAMPDRFRLPDTDIRGGKLRAVYQVNRENDSELVHSGIREAIRMDSLYNRKGRGVNWAEKYDRSFVRTQLVSNWVEIDRENW
ncbi:MAG: hypothetical protein NTW29_02335 [Bacteroidetes bacterium]|nr:hypothetical protein [Bacteroidota bacterium]